MDSSFKRNNFDLLRIVAAAQVMIGHSIWHMDVTEPRWLPLLKAFPGVSIFFVISGFLISASYERSSSLASYARNRALRIFPGLWCCVFLTVVVASCFGFDFATSRAVLWLFSQLGGAIYTPHFLSGFGFGSYNGSLWTIPIELQFYILLPILYRLYSFQEEKKKTLIVFFTWAIFVCIAFASRLQFSSFDEPNDEPLFQKLYRYSFIPHFYLFLTGVLLQRLKAHQLECVRGKGLQWLSGYIVLYFLLPSHAMTYIISMLLLAVTSISLAYSSTELGHKMLRGNDISYGVYIYHGLMINIFVELGLIRRGDYVCLLAFLTVCIAYLSWTLIESPALRRKKHTNAAVLTAAAEKQ